MKSQAQGYSTHSTQKLLSRLEGLIQRHQGLEESVARAHSSYINDQNLNKLKLERLYVKQEIERIRCQLEGSE
jgi:hypothetical protein